MISGLPTNVPNTCKYGHVDVLCWNTISKRQTLPRKVCGNNHLLCRTRLRAVFVRCIWRGIVNFTRNLKSAVFYRQITMFGTSARYNTVRDTAGVMRANRVFHSVRFESRIRNTLRNEKATNVYGHKETRLRVFGLRGRPTNRTRITLCIALCVLYVT